MLTYTPEAEAFRVEVKAWLTENLPKGWFNEGFEMTSDERKKFNLEWPSKLHAGGWICATWPTEYGGKGLNHIARCCACRRVCKREGSNARRLLR